MLVPSAIRNAESEYITRFAMLWVKSSITSLPTNPPHSAVMTALPATEPG